VENLEAQFKMVEVRQTLSDRNIDDSQLGRVKDLIADVRARLNVADRLATATAQVNVDGEIPVSAPASDDIVEQVTEYFSAANTQVADSGVNAQQ